MKFGDAVQKLFGVQVRPLSICKIGEVGETCFCRRKEEISHMKEGTQLQRSESLIKLDWTGPFRPASPEPDMSQANICLPGQECQDEGCFSMDPGFTDRMWAAMYDILPKIIEALKNFYTKKIKTDEDLQELGSKIWGYGKSMIGRSLLENSASPEPPITQDELFQVPASYIYTKESIVRTKESRNEDEGSMWIRDIWPDETIDVLKVRMMSRSCRRGRFEVIFKNRKQTLEVGLL